MDEGPPPTPAGDLLSRFFQRLEAGEEVDLEELCTRNPQLESRLRELFARGLGPTAAEPGGEPSSSGGTSVMLRIAARARPFERYRLEGELARGGMGRILRVWDQDLRRHLAMKVLLTGDAPGATPPAATHPLTLGRFLEEAQVTGQLDHPGIAPVHELGLDGEGRAYFTMKLVKGRTLREVFDLTRSGAEGWTRAAALGVLLKVCDAMAYAHDKGVVHRDLKPANVMVGRFGEVYVMDWGLAKVLGRDEPRAEPAQEDFPRSSIVVESDRHESASADEGSPLRTLDGDVLGTPAYMSPEQAAGRLSEMGPRSDVYSLGAMLYHLLAGHVPYAPPGARRGNVEVLERVRAGPPEPLAEQAEDAPPELVALCEKAMARDPAQRYADMSELGADLHAFVEGRVVRAYETGALAELRKWVARNRKLAAASVVAILALVVGLVVSLALRAEAVTQRRNVLQLSAFQELDRLRARADRLWPVTPARIPDYRAWLDDARDLVGGLHGGEGHDGYVAQLRRLRERALPADGEDLETALAEHPRYPELGALEGELEVRRAARAVRDGEREVAGFTLDEATLEAIQDRPAEVLNDWMAWPLVDPARRLFGREAEGLELARLARLEAREALAAAGEDEVEARGELARIEDTLAWAAFALGLDDEARAAARDALEHAPSDSRAGYERGLARLERAIGEARGDQELAALDRLESQARLLREEIAAGSTWRFTDDETAWWHGQLVQLVQQLEALDDPETGLIRGLSPEHGPGLERRLALAERVEELTVSGAEARRAWNEAVLAVRRSPRYGGLVLAPQVGLLPLGPDPRSGLWEFAHVASGEVPRREADGRLAFGEESCVVLVLLPGGRTTMGAQKDDPAGPFYSADAAPDERPVHEVDLPAVFLSKYELTQAQWERLTGTNPSLYKSGSLKRERPIRPTNPVEQVSWEDATRVLAWLDLELPTEAHWERGARAGSDTPWFFGATPDGVERAANLADRAALGEDWPALDPEPVFDDGHVVHAPVGSFEPNAFGLHDVLGNVTEWCRDPLSDYRMPLEADGERVAWRARKRIVRGGSFTEPPEQARSSFRRSENPDFLYPNLGLRPARDVRD